MEINWSDILKILSTALAMVLMGAGMWTRLH